MCVTVYAVVKYTLPIQNNVRIKGYGMKLWRVDASQEITAFNWGDTELGAAKTTDMVFGFTQKMTIKNTGDYPIYPMWQIDPATPLPANVTIQASHTNMEGEPYQADWQQNQVDSMFDVVPGGVPLDRIMWTLTVNTQAAPGTYNFTILLLAADTSSG